MGNRVTRFSSIHDIKCCPEQQLINLSDPDEYTLFITHEYPPHREHGQLSITRITKLPHIRRCSLLTNDRRVVDCTGKDFVSHHQSYLYCSGQILISYIDDVPIYAKCVCLINTDDKFTVILEDNTIQYVSTSKTCFVANHQDQDNYDIIPFTDLFVSPLKQDYSYNKGKLMDYLLTCSDNKFTDTYETYTDMVKEGKDINIVDRVCLKLTNSVYIIYPIVFGWTISDKSPLRKVNCSLGRSLDDFCFDLEADTLSKVMGFILEWRYPDIEEIDENTDLIENCIRIYHVLDYLGILNYPEFYKGMTCAIEKEET